MLPKVSDKLPKWIRIMRDPLLRYESKTLRKKANRINGPQDVAKLLKQRALQEENEVCYVLLLDTNGRVLALQEIGRGSVNAMQIDIRSVFRSAIAYNATRIVLAHNHPSGSITPSAEDIVITRKLCMVGELIGIEVVDHVIIGRGGKWYSLITDAKRGMKLKASRKKK